MSPTTIDPQRFGSQKAVAIASGDNHTCVIDNGLVSCWGGNFEICAIQNGGTTHQNTPTPTSSLGSD